MPRFPASMAILDMLVTCLALYRSTDVLINYTLTYLGYTGGVRTFYEIGKRLLDKGHSLTLTVLYDPRRSRYDWKGRIVSTSPILTLANRVIYHEIFRGGLAYELNAIELLRRVTPDCDVNVATTYLSAFPVYYSQKGVSIHHMQHDETLFVSDPGARALAVQCYHTPLQARIANSTWLKQRVAKEYGISAKLALHAIAHDVFYPRQVGRKSAAKRVVCMGKRTAWKGFSDALEAMKLVMRNRKDVEWYVYGQDASVPRDSGAPFTFVQFPSDDELAELYSSADVVICPSWYESFPAPPLEAMACGVPVVTTKLGTEDYAIDGQNALVVAPRDPQSLSRAILRLLDDESLAARLRQNGPDTAQLYTWDRTADNVEGIFREMLAGAH